ncbi:LuxR C-terminal-related transcriptional regulator [Allomesorhizobium camelthorni]|uniref:Helix-turn-helix transcriptional regulator n=1 Tax=Allomesorhizobium camelthorni TaxID=475069 RepID=A0A6G4WLR3_9HYPH|nr:LuxR C-terminal-related transcriptional regulator [Mesorhizobium camelthorni]NGO55564.1 helix-turn-helix transcriptional regulator [Mesorhizobium camelthorni]
MADERVQRRLAAIMAADVVGYSRLMGADEAATLAALKAHRKELVDAKIAEHQGRIVKLIGDGMLVEFTSVVNAVACAAEIQRKMRERNADVPEERRIEFRIGINLGDIILDEDDIYGDGVNVAARLESIAKPGGISISASVREHIGNRLDIAFEDTGEQVLKNIERPVRVYRVTLGPSTTVAAIGAGVDKRHPNALNDTMRAELEQARDCYRRRAWADAFDALCRADQEMPLEAEDLERLAISAFLTNRDDDCLRALDRSYHTYLDAGECARAVRAAFWLGFRLAGRGEIGPATGWFARAQRLLENEATDCVERGYLLLPTVEQQLAAGDYDAAFRVATAAVEIGERFREADLVAAALHLQGRVLIRKGQIESGLAHLDEAMVAVTAGELSPLMTGLIYCSVIAACQEVYALSRAREWTSALAQWCNAQPQIVAFTGSCLVHRAEIMQLGGAWRDAIEEAGRACERFLKGIDPQPPAPAFYQRAEMHRLRGEFSGAEEDYQRARQFGREPQPGLALLRLAQGRKEAAAATTRRVMSAITDPLRRARFLPAHIEIVLAAGEIEEADRACRELEEIAAGFETGVLGAMAAQARGAVALAGGEAEAALVALRRALEVWQEIEAPYETARVRVLIGLACRVLRDEDSAELELAAARATFEQLGATPDLARIDALTLGARPGKRHGLTVRELQVLRLVSAGKTNGAIAAELFLSERTIERHVSNIFTKLDLPSRAAATAWAYERRLI